ncbi:MAG: hypothetical protein AAB152_08095 [Candidatus Coatesbacteria bacterium]
MKALRTIGLAVAVVALTGVAVAAPAQNQGEGRVGLGMNLGTLEATYSLNTQSALGAAVNLDLMTGDFDSTNFGLTAWFQQKLKSREPVDFFMLAGLGFGSQKVGTDKTSGFQLFAGLGTEYFLPGTKSLSIEAKLGLVINFLSQTVPFFNPVTLSMDSAKASGTEISFKDLTGGLFILRYYLD